MEIKDQSLIIVEDNPADMTLYLRLLDDVGHRFGDIRCLDNLADAKKIITESPPDCCLLDFYLPDGDALSFLQNISQEDEQTTCPIVVITGQKDTEKAVQIMQLGAQDYLVKDSIDADKLSRAIHHSTRTWKLQQQLNRLALYDPLTQLANRALFIDRLSRMFTEYSRYKKSMALLYIDLDYFKIVNDTHGHEAGDYLLVQFCRKMIASLRKSDLAARLGGDEFAVLLPDITEAKAHHVAFKLVNNLTFDLPWKESFISVSSSIGLATFPSKARCYQELMRDADYALYRAKRNGKGQYSAYNKTLEIETRRSIEMCAHLPRALKNNDLCIAYQPVVDLTTNEVAGVEAFTRWHYEGAWIPPAQVISCIMEQRLNAEFHHWLFRRSIAQLALWQREMPALGLALNLPANLCHDTKILGQLLPIIHSHNLDPGSIYLEVTETHLIRYPEDTRERLFELANSGVKIAIDDFGTGYSSMQYLATLPCDAIKIDQSFFKDIERNTRSVQIIEAMTALAHRLNMSVVAEGIETPALLSAAKKYGCDFAQGYYLGMPVISRNQNFREFLDESRQLGELNASAG